MKKSELKQLIREVIEETNNNMEATPMTDAELGDGSDLSSIADAVEFAKKLERMLNAEKAMVKKLQAELRDKSGFTNSW
jgi:hypothetical protein